MAGWHGDRALWLSAYAVSARGLCAGAGGAAPAAAPADWRLLGGRLWGASRRTRRGVGGALRAGPRPRAGGAVSAAGRHERPAAVCVSGGDRPPHRRSGTAADAPGHPGALSAGAGAATHAG